MGIPGLTAFINNRSNRSYLRPYELRDSYLVIDGNNVSCKIYQSYGESNCAFGGDYDSYAHAVSTFFDDLIQCRITPLVLFDGGPEDRKFRTIIKRTKQKVQRASTFSPADQCRSKFLPVLQGEVFRDVLRKKNIKQVQCLFEADNEIAALAKMLNCPVLSDDSDFYLYGSLYIPFNTLINGITRLPGGRRYAKRCKIYRVEYLLNSFRGLSESMLPLAAILFGNDYVKQGTFKSIFHHLELNETSGDRYNRFHCIKTIFMWLSKLTLDEAVKNILIRIPKSSRQSVLDLIEDNLNYTNALDEILTPLRLPRDYTARVNMHDLNRRFTFSEDINTLQYIGEACEGAEDETSEQEDDEIELINSINETQSMSRNEVISNLPKWFLNEYLLADFSPYFMNFIVRRLYMGPIQIENDDYSSSNVISFKIIKVLFGLLKSAINDKVLSMKCVIRDQDRIVGRELQGTERLKCCELPSLSDLRETPLGLRREILNETLGIHDDDHINELPPEWMLYFGCIKYWIREEESSVFHKANVYAIIIGMMFHIIDSKIGTYRTFDNFEARKGQAIEAIQQKRRTNNYKPHYRTNGTVIEAYKEIDYEDCLLAAPFFISHFRVDRELHSNPKKINRSIVHAFAEFQISLRHAMSLNALLGYPYQQTISATFYNGTLLYNLSNNFRTHQDIEKYISTELEMSPSLLRLFHMLLSKVKSEFTTLFYDEVNHSTK